MCSTLEQLQECLPKGLVIVRASPARHGNVTLYLTRTGLPISVCDILWHIFRLLFLATHHDHVKCQPISILWHISLQLVCWWAHTLEEWVTSPHSSPFHHLPHLFYSMPQSSNHYVGPISLQNLATLTTNAIQKAHLISSLARNIIQEAVGKTAGSNGRGGGSVVGKPPTLAVKIWRAINGSCVTTSSTAPSATHHELPGDVFPWTNLYSCTLWTLSTSMTTTLLKTLTQSDALACHHFKNVPNLCAYWRTALQNTSRTSNYVWPNQQLLKV